MTQSKEERSAQQKLYYADNRGKKVAYAKDYRTANKEKIAAKDKLRYAADREKKVAYAKDYYAANKKNLAAKAKLYRAANKERIIVCKKEYCRKQVRDNNLDYLIPKRLRTRLKNAIKNNYKSGSAVDSLGCSICEFKLMIESLFTDGMTWENWGTVWHLDHIIPMSAFDLQHSEEIEVACHHTNLQPLLAADNLTKGSKSPA